MAKISNFQRIIKENVPSEFASIVNALGSSVNSFGDEVTTAINGNLTVDDNLNMMYKDINLSVNASGTPITTTQYRSTLRGKTRGIIVVKVENLTTSNTYPTGTPFISFEENSQLITIKNITNLAISTKYKITLLALG